MPQRFDPTTEQRKTLDALAEEIPGIQRTFVNNHPRLIDPDRGAHQQQLAGGRVLLEVSDHLPQEMLGLGLFEPASRHIGIGRISTGLGCPHAETDPDFLGLMLAFRTVPGKRVDFVCINDPTAPTRTPGEFISLLKATADAAGTRVGSHDAINAFASQAELLLSLARHAGLRAPGIATHVVGQTSRTVRSSSAYQQYWAGVVKAREVFGKFTLAPTSDVNSRRKGSSGPKYLSEDWRLRQKGGDLTFGLYWIAFTNETDTPLADLTKAWKESHRVHVGTVTFPQTDPESTESRLLALLAAEMGANPGHWIEDSATDSPLPATEYTAARFLAYQVSQQQRNALPEASYASYFERGELSSGLASELVRRYGRKRASGHDAPDLGELVIR